MGTSRRQWFGDIGVPIICVLVSFFAGLTVDALYRPTRDEVERMIDVRIVTFHLQLIKELSVANSLIKEHQNDASEKATAKQF